MKGGDGTTHCNCVSPGPKRNQVVAAVMWVDYGGDQVGGRAGRTVVPGGLTVHSLQIFLLALN